MQQDVQREHVPKVILRIAECAPAGKDLMILLIVNLPAGYSR